MNAAIRKRFAQIGFLVLLQAVALFASVGKWDWWNAWSYLGLYIAFIAVNAIVLLPGHKELVQERSQIGEGAKGWDKIIGGIGAFGGLAILVVAGLEERFSWPGGIRLEVQIGAFVILALSYALFAWAMVSNKFFSTIVRIQKDRGHTVQTGGPYRFVRHPGYAGLIITYLAAPLTLGSLWAFVPVAILIASIFLRTSLEDRTLQSELEGYKEYAGRVRYRLIPGVW